MIKVLNATEKPITFMGKVAGVCYNSDIENADKNYKRGLKNIKVIGFSVAFNTLIINNFSNLYLYF